MSNKLKQAKLDAIVAKKLHIKRQNKAVNKKNGYNVIAIVTPLLFIAAQHFITNSEFFNNLSSAASVILIICASLYSYFRIDDKIVKHKIAMRDSIETINKCDEAEEYNEKELSIFFKFITETDKNDEEMLKGVSKKERQEAYKEALKEYEPGNTDITCPYCGSSPWRYTKGSCDACGNKPAR